MQYYYKNTRNVQNYQQFLNNVKTELLELLVSIVEQHPIKFNLKLEATYNIPLILHSSENR